MKSSDDLPPVFIADHRWQHYHSELEQTNCPKGSDSALVSRAIVGTTPNAQANPRILVFWKKSIFHFLEPKKSILLSVRGPNKTFMGPQTFFDPYTYGFRGSYYCYFLIWEDFQSQFWPENLQKLMLISTNARNINPLNHNFRGQKRSGDP